MKCPALCLAYTSVFAIIAPVIAEADPLASAGTITELQTGWAGEGIYITLNPTPTPTNLVCKDGRILMPTSLAQYKENLAMLLIARQQNATVTIAFNNTSCTPGGTTYAFVSMNW
jgi:hypothetical protein